MLSMMSPPVNHTFTFIVILFYCLCIVHITIKTCEKLKMIMGTPLIWEIVFNYIIGAHILNVKTTVTHSQALWNMTVH